MAFAPRIPQVKLAKLLEESNPHIDLKVESYEKSTRSFLQAVNAYRIRSIEHFSKERAKHTNDKKKIQERIQEIATQANQYKLREIELVQELAKENEERKVAEQAVNALKRRHASLQEKHQLIETEIEQYRANTSNLKRERSEERSILGQHAARTSPEVDACERSLSCIIEGIEKDQILVRFYRLDPSDHQREFSFVLDVGDTYKVITSSPVLPSLPILIDELNTSKDIFQFIKRVRMGYQQLVQECRTR